MIRRSALVALALPLLGACQMAAYEPGRQMAYDQQRLASLLGTRTAQAPQRCIQSFPGMEYKTIGNTIVARSGGRFWVNQPTGNCSEADGAGAFLVLQPDPGGLNCENSQVRVTSGSGMSLGSCVLGPWTPYR